MGKGGAMGRSEGGVHVATWDKDKLRQRGSHLPFPDGQGKAEAGEDGDEEKEIWRTRRRLHCWRATSQAKPRGPTEAEGIIREIRQSATLFSIVLIKITHGQKCISNYFSLYL